MSMPYWWTLDMDIELLQSVLVCGYGNWKKLLQESALLPPAEGTSQVPPKVNGMEWVLTLTPKALEKRIASLLRGLPAVHTLPIPPPTSPASTRKAIMITAATKARGGIGALFSKISSSKVAAPAVVGAAPAAVAPAEQLATPATPAAAASIPAGTEPNQAMVKGQGMMEIDLVEDEAVATATPAPEVVRMEDKESSVQVQEPAAMEVADKVKHAIFSLCDHLSEPEPDLINAYDPQGVPAVEVVEVVEEPAVAVTDTPALPAVDGMKEDVFACTPVQSAIPATQPVNKAKAALTAAMVTPAAKKTKQPRATKGTTPKTAPAVNTVTPAKEKDEVVCTAVESAAAAGEEKATPAVAPKKGIMQFFQKV